MRTVRVIPCLDVDAGRVVKGVNFVDLKEAGDPVVLASRYDEMGADEIVFLDITASSDDRETMVDVVRRTADQVFIPLTVGGGIRSVEDARRMLRDGYNFSLSGLKTAVVNHVRNNPDVNVADVAASFQAAAIDVLVTKARRAAAETGANGICIGGGVAANSLLRTRITDACAEDGIDCFVPSRELCTDNAAMVAAAGWWRYQADGATPLDVGALPNLRLA